MSYSEAVTVRSFAGPRLLPTRATAEGSSGVGETVMSSPASSDRSPSAMRMIDRCAPSSPAPDRPGRTPSRFVPAFRTPAGSSLRRAFRFSGPSAGGRSLHPDPRAKSLRTANRRRRRRWRPDVDGDHCPHIGDIQYCGKVRWRVHARSGRLQQDQCDRRAARRSWQSEGLHSSRWSGMRPNELRILSAGMEVLCLLPTWNSRT